MNRRQFLQTMGATWAAASTSLPAFALQPDGSEGTRPNILWISTEDISPDLGCYGDPYAVTPNIDAFAATGVRFTQTFTSAGVCAPMRSGTITGMYQDAIGTGPMRCKGVPPVGVKCFPEYLRAAGYYCTNNVKTDYQFDAPVTAWDESSRTAHWRKRRPGQPFFSVINFMTTHESKIREPAGKKAVLHDPAKAVVSPYYPDTPLVRNDLACYADNITTMDKEVAGVLKELREDGLAENTIVWFWGDHGRGLGRCKRWVYDSGLRIPLLIHVPERLKPLAYSSGPAPAAGSTNDELVSSIDFAPTVLSLAGVPVPAHMQGRAFLGPQRGAARQYIHGARDRIDEAPDCVRSVHDGRFIYVRNFMPFVPYSVNVDYMNLMPTMREMRRLNAEGKLTGAQRQYFRYPRDVEELYDVSRDRYEINNLAGDSTHTETLNRLKTEMFRWMRDIQDVGLIPEPDFDALKRPGDHYDKTNVPEFAIDRAQGALTLRCATPGASIAYRARGDRNWSLYAQPIAFKQDQTIEAKACRLGFQDSDVVVLVKGVAPKAKPALPHTPHWRDQIAGTDWLDQVLAIKLLDEQGARAIPGYFSALGNKHGPVRFWAVRGLTYASLDAADKARAAMLFEGLLSDSSPSTRIAAAQALCMWGDHAQALNVLVTTLKKGHDSARHWAAVALQAIGDRARPALNAIQASLKDSNRNVVDVSRYTLRALGVPEVG